MKRIFLAVIFLSGCSHESMIKDIYFAPSGDLVMEKCDLSSNLMGGTTVTECKTDMVPHRAK